MPSISPLSIEDGPVSMQTPHNHKSVGLVIDRLSKSYTLGGSCVQALDDVSFTVPDGGIIAVSGPSGSGKSTLFNLIAGFDRPDSGRILVGGTDVTTVADRDMDGFRNETLGFIFQRFNLLPVLSAQENVELALLPRGLARAECRSRAEAALAAVGLAARRHHRPDQLSGGQQQRVAVARALVGNPQLVLADEPTGNLDGRSAGDILDLIATLHATYRTCFLIATHDPRVLKAAHRVITLTDGRLSEGGTHA